jgi:putative hemolysin
MLQPVEPAIQKIFLIDRLRELYQAAGTYEKLPSLLGVGVEVQPEDLERIPRTGGLLAVANHPFGLLEAIILASELPKVRPDMKIVANSMLSGVAELRNRCIFVDPFGRRGSVGANATALRECLSWLKRGHALLAFPAGEVAHWNVKDGAVADPPWNPALARIAQIARAAALPIFFHGANSLAFQISGMIHPSLRTASLPRELINKRGRKVRVRIGSPVSTSTLRSFPRAEEAIEYLRCRTYLLEGAPDARNGGFAPWWKPAPIASAVPVAEMANEIARLDIGRRLCEAGELSVYVGTAKELPAVLREIGRLREISFRQAGEGTGRAADLDRFDRYYRHLVLWNEAAKEVVGSYRLGPSPDVLPGRGIGGWYTSTLFRYRKDLFERLGPAVELGRSFIRREYQKQYSPLLLLWKGIARYVASRPECATLFGAVSISSDYHPVSRHLIVKFLEAHRVEDLSGFISPRCPYRPDERLFRRTGIVRRVPSELEELSALIAELEQDGKGVPILIKQYLKTGGRLLGFNVDRSFGNALDALILVDLRTAPAALLDRYMGKERAAEFRAWHAAKC